MPRLTSRLLALSCVLALSACDDGKVLTDADAGADASSPNTDAGLPLDASTMDASPGRPDAGPPDAGHDAGPPCYELDPSEPQNPVDGAWLEGFAHPGVGGGVTAFAFGPGDTVYVGGSFKSAGYLTVSNVAAWSATSGWSALGEGVPGMVSALAVGGDGALYAAHLQPDSFTAYRISRWDGTSWTTFADADATISEMQFVGSHLFVVGDFTTIGGEGISSVAYHDGSAWRGYEGVAPDRIVQSISAVALDDVCIGGQFATLGVVAAQNVACWNGSEWTARDFPPPPPSGPPPFGRPTYWSINELKRDPADGSLVAAGSFQLDDTGTKGGGIARWTGSEWALIGDGVMEFGPGSAGVVSSFVITPTGLYAGGTFRYANASMDPPTEVNDVARWDGTSWHPMGGGLFAEGGGFGGRAGAVAAIAVGPDGSIYFGGAVTRADTMAVGYVVRWDGTYWRSLRTAGERYDGISGEVHTLARRGRCEVYVGGDFRYAGPVRANSIARFTFERGYEALGDGLLGTVFDIEVTRDGLVYAAGNFTDESGTGLRNLAVWDGLEWRDIGGGVGNPADPTETVRSIAVVEGTPIVYAAGGFTMAGGERVTGLAMWDGTAWTDLGASLRGHELTYAPGRYADPWVSAVLVDPETGDLVVAGAFSAVGEGDDRIETNNVARWDGVRWHAFGDGAGDRDSTVVSATFWNGRLTVARTYAEDDPLRFAVWNGTEWEPIGTDQPGFTIPTSIDGIGDTLFVAGNWVGGNHLAVYDGTTWSAVGGGANDSGVAVVMTEGGAFFGGVFERVGATGVGGLAFWRYAE